MVHRAATPSAAVPRLFFQARTFNFPLKVRSLTVKRVAVLQRVGERVDELDAKDNMLQYYRKYLQVKAADTSRRPCCL